MTSSMLKRYAVISPDYETYSGSWEGLEPPEYGADYVEVEASNKREAKIFAVKLWRKQRGRTYVKWCSDENPFARLVVEAIDERDAS